MNLPAALVSSVDSSEVLPRADLPFACSSLSCYPSACLLEESHSTQACSLVSSSRSEVAVDPLGHLQAVGLVEDNSLSPWVGLALN